jgi:hypothetical protein
LFLGYVRSGRFRPDQVRAKFVYSHTRIRIPAAQEISGPMLDRALARLDAVLAEMRL